MQNNLEIIHRGFSAIGRKYVPTILRSMGIQFKGSGARFWLDNEAELEYLYYDFCERARQMKRDLHPDKHQGRGEKQYAEMMNTFASAERSFGLKGIGPKVAIVKRSRLERDKEKDRIWRQKNRERLAEYQRNYGKLYRERLNARNRASYHRRKKQPHTKHGK